MPDLDRMTKRLEATDDEARLTAIGELIEQGAANPAALDLLLEHLDREPLETFRARIIRHLGERKHVAARERLARFAGDPDAGAKVTQAAEKALQQIELARSESG